MVQNTEQNLLTRIRGKGRGWVFSQADFAQFASRESIDVALHRLHNKGVIRRVLRGVYDYPRYSESLASELSPDMDSVALAIARKFGWRIQPNGAAALNLLGISTQVPAGYVYLSSGPGRVYDVNGTALTFKHTALKEAGFQYRESALIVQGLKSLGSENLSSQVINRIRRWLPTRLRNKVLADARTATGWVYAAIRRICAEGSDE